MRNIKINGHGHLLPYPNQIPSFMKEKKLFWIDEDKAFMRQGTWSRPITDASFFLEEKLEWMEQMSSTEVVLCLSRLYCNGLSASDCFDALRFQNDYNAMVEQTHPSKFTCGFVVQPLHMEQALKEIKRCVEIQYAITVFTYSLFKCRRSMDFYSRWVL